jgi:hypothetical protein
MGYRQLGGNTGRFWPKVIIVTTYHLNHCTTTIYFGVLIKSPYFVDQLQA